MKYRYAAVLLSLTLSTAALGGCSSAGEDTKGAEEILYGQVTEIGDNTVTVELGTQKEMSEMPEKETNKEKETDSEGGQSTDGKEAPSMLELTGETKTIRVTDETEITQGGMERPDGKEVPDGEAPNGEAPNGEAPDGEKPDGEAPDGEKPDGEAPDGEAKDGQMPEAGKELTLSDLKEGDIISFELDTDGSAESVTVMSMGMGGMGGQSVESYDAVKDLTQDTAIDGEEIVSTGTDENAVHGYEGAEVTVKNASVSRKSADSTGGDMASFYGVGAALLDTEGMMYVNGGTVDTDAAGAAGIFAYGDGTVYVTDTSITTKQDTSGGIHAAGGGTLYAWNAVVKTGGESSAAIRSDRGGGKMVVNGGTYTSTGSGSPAVYSTADIAINHAVLTAEGSEAICIEGQNSIRLFDCDVTGNMSDLSQNDCTWNVILYQSMSGDATEGNSVFEMDGGTLTAKNGGMFYTTNTESTIVLSDVDITCADDSKFFLRCTGNANERGWGSTGDNGADCHFTAISQEAKGDIVWDSISELDVYLTEASTLTGAVVKDNSYAGSGGDGCCSLYVDADSKWIVTGDSVLSKLDVAGTIVDTDGKAVTVKGTDGTVYETGTGKYTVMVDTYEKTGDVSGASEKSAWSSYETEKPAK